MLTSAYSVSNSGLSWSDLTGSAELAISKLASRDSRKRFTVETAILLNDLNMGLV